MLLLKSALLKNKGTNLFTNRDRLAIIANMLLEGKRGLTKTQFTHYCNLNWQQLHVYLDLLLMKNLISREADFDGSEKFVTTQKGIFFVNEFQHLQSLMK